MAENKTKPTRASVPEFLSQLHEARRADAKRIIRWMRRATGKRPTMWGPSIIGFGSCHYRYDSGREGEMPLLAFSPRKAATVLYLMPGFGESKALLAKLGKHTTGKSCLYIRKLDDIDEQVLVALIEASVIAMRRRYPEA